MNIQFIFLKSIQPKYGWYHPCFMCDICTSQYFIVNDLSSNDFSFNNIQYNVYTCKYCQSHINSSPMFKTTFYNDLINFIK